MEFQELTGVIEKGTYKGTNGISSLSCCTVNSTAVKIVSLYRLEAVQRLLLKAKPKAEMSLSLRTYSLIYKQHDTRFDLHLENLKKLYHSSASRHCFLHAHSKQSCYKSRTRSQHRRYLESLCLLSLCLLFFTCKPIRLSRSILEDII